MLRQLLPKGLVASMFIKLLASHLGKRCQFIARRIHQEEPMIGKGQKNKNLLTATIESLSLVYTQAYILY